jgi:hypothetical protein
MLPPVMGTQVSPAGQSVVVLQSMEQAGCSVPSAA